MTASLVAGRVQIRPPRTADAEQLGVLNRQLGYVTEIQELVSRIDRLSELHEHFVAVAEVDGAVVGWVQAEHRFSIEAGDKAELVGLIVGAAARRSGSGPVAGAGGRGLGGRSRPALHCCALERNPAGVALFLQANGVYAVEDATRVCEVLATQIR